MEGIARLAQFATTPQGQACAVLKTTNTPLSDCTNGAAPPASPTKKKMAEQPAAAKPVPPAAEAADLEVDSCISWGNQSTNIGDKFESFRAERMREHRLAKFMARKQRSARKTPAAMDRLRSKFVAQCKKYTGVPYARKYHEPGTPDHDAPLFLDCCALVRRAVDDLTEDFGFRVGRWNQAYQYDTLYNARVADIAQLKPGDLVFYEATYYSEKSKKQKYDMVHVEVFLGLEGGGTTPLSTIGARKQKGHIQVFDSYAFESKSYHSIKFHFCSLDPWLRGECKPELSPGHWIEKNPSLLPGRKSVFRDDDEEACEGAGGSDCEEDGEAGTAGQGGGSGGGGGVACGSGASAVDGAHGGARAAAAPRFFVGKGNGWRLVAKALAARGWEQLDFKLGFSADFELKWVERRSELDYVHHRPERGQLLNHIPNNHVLTTKLGLLATLRDKAAADGAPMPGFFPESFRLDHPAEGLALLTRHEALLAEAAAAATTEATEEQPVWIFKPNGGNCGRGIEVLHTTEQLRAAVFGPAGGGAEADAEQAAGGGEEAVAAAAAAARPADRQSQCDKDSSVVMQPALVQRYLTRPLLLGGRKFDMRAYCLVARTAPHACYFHMGYVRRSMCAYSDDYSNQFVHLTNAAVQKKHGEYKAKKAAAATTGASEADAADAATIWSMEQLDACLAAEGVAAAGWAASSTSGGLVSEMKRVMVHTWQAGAPKLQAERGYFDLLGFDFMLDASLGVHLLEVNTNPALHLDCEHLEELLPPMVEGALDLVLKLSPPLPPGVPADKLVADLGAVELERRTEAGFELIVDEASGYTFGS